MDSREDKLSLERCESVRDMAATPGWRVIKDWINSRITSEIEALQTCSLKEVMPKRQGINALKTILLKVDEMIKAAREEGSQLY